MNNFCFITPSKLIKAHPDEAHKLKKLIHLSKVKDKLCEVCEMEKAWRYGECGMCFTCTTGESDASDDYELVQE